MAKFYTDSSVDSRGYIIVESTSTTEPFYYTATPITEKTKKPKKHYEKFKDWRRRTRK